MQSFSEPKGDDNPFLQLTVASLPDDVDCLFFSWRTALFGRYDVFHVHWVESLIAGRGRFRTALTWVAMSALLARLKLLGTPVVRTLHNRSSRGRRGRAYEQFLKRSLDAATVTCIRMNSDNMGLKHARTVVIPHGHYRDWYTGHSVPPSIDGRILNFGLVRRYKGLDQLLPAFEKAEATAAELRIVGKVVDADVGQMVNEFSRRDSRITLVPGHATEEVLAREIGECELVVLPYDELYNSGCLFLALSLDRPVLVPAGDFVTELQNEVGAGWVHSYLGRLDAIKLSEAMHSVRHSKRSPIPDLSRREWPKIGEALWKVYCDAKESS
ncbi:GDP-mannose--glycolipid 4-beta-D-mannosyltransferase [Actinomycetes bacterium M1A6_2h]